MPLVNGGLTKLAEEAGEMIQRAMKKVAYPNDVMHPDGTNINERLEEEIADTLAAAEVVSVIHGLNRAAIRRRIHEKRDLFLSWYQEP